jgi:hypothetical protein
MSYVFEIQDPRTSEWVIRAEGEEARTLAVRFGSLVDTGVVCKFAIDEDGEIIEVISDASGAMTHDPGDGRRTVLARFRQLPA